MTVLVIGKTGQLAVALSEFYNWQFVGRNEADLAEPGAAARVVAQARPAWVVNTAALTAVDLAETDPALAERINAEAVGEVAAAAAEVGAAFLHISTDYVFDGMRSRPWRENDSALPLSVYGRTKLAGERLALAAGRRVIVLRSAWLYAPWGTNFVRTMLRLAAERPRLSIVGDQRGSPTSALDLARACGRVVQALGEAPAHDGRWGIYHYSGSGTVSRADFARQIFAGAACRQLISRVPEVETVDTADFPTPARRPGNSTLDCSKFARTFGMPSRPWRESLAETLDRISAEVAV